MTATNLSSTEKVDTPFENCLEPLLLALKWNGKSRALKESLPHFNNIVSAEGFCDVLENLNFDSRKVEIKTKNLDPRLMPCLLITEDNKPIILLSQEDGEVAIFDGASNERKKVLQLDLLAFSKKVTLYTFKVKDNKSTDVKRSWLHKTLAKNKPLITNAVFLSIILNLLILATPLFVMAVYDRVIGVSSIFMLSEFVIGVFIALIGIFVIYRIRAEHLALVGARFDKAIGDKVFSRLLYLAPVYTESATAGSQVARLKDFDRVREFISGPLLSVFFEIPFIVIALVIIGILGGMLVLIPILMLAIFFLLGTILNAKNKPHMLASSKQSSELQEFLLESIKSMRALKYTAAVNTWESRYREMSAKSNLSTLKVSLFHAINTSISEFIMIAAGMAVLSFGALRVMHGELTVGAMIALMILVWRVLAPIKTIFNTLPKLQQLVNSSKQINNLMNLTPESEQSTKLKNDYVKFDGNINFNRVSMRYPSAYTPSLLNLAFEIDRGEIVGVVGRNGSGKSTLLKVLLGLYQPQAGNILIDNCDIRQLNPIELRLGMGYLPQVPELFYGSIAANLRLSDPTASDEQLYEAAKSAGILDKIMSFPDGFDTMINDQSSQRLASSFQQALCLARTYLRRAPILLLDEPGNTLDNNADQQLMNHINKLRGDTTVVMVTHRPSHLRNMDKILLLEQGQLMLQGPPDEVIPKIPKELL